ncbi:MAG: FAD-dependent oxidoreductase [Sandaracinus sp.]
MGTRFVVVGSGYAGVLAAVRLAAHAGPGAVTLVDPVLKLVERVRLHEALVHGRDVEVPLEALAERCGIHLVRGRVRDLRAHAVTLEDGRDLPFERCIVATGSEIARGTPGSREHAHALEPGTVAGLRDELSRAQRVAVLGGGLTGVEVAAEIAETTPGKRVALVTRALVPMQTPAARAHIEGVLRRLGVELVLGERVEEIERGRARTSERSVPFDLAIDTLGFASRAPAFLSGPTDAMGRVLTDTTLAMRGRPDVFLAGDLAAPEGTLAGEPMIRGCQSAMPMGAHAADAAWASVRGEPVLPFVFQPNGFCISLGRHEGAIDAYGRVLRRRAAVWVKEGICRYTIAAIRWQARGIDYRWRPFVGRRARALAALPAASLTEASAS